MPLPPTLAALAGPAPQPTPSAGPSGPGLRVKFATDRVQPPIGLYVHPEDSFQWLLLSTQAGVTVQLNMVVLRPDGTIYVQQELLVTTGSRAQQSMTKTLPEGFLLNVTIIPVSGGFIRGQIFTHLAYSRGGAVSTLLLRELVQGYTTLNCPVTWPAVRPDAPTAGAGFLNNRTIANPGAGVEFSFSTPAATRFRVLGVVATLTTSAVAGNRVPILILDDGVFAVNRMVPVTPQAASLVVTYSWSPGVNANATVGVNAQCSLPVQAMLGATWRVRSSTVALDAGDTWTSIQLATEEWSDI